MADNDSKSTRTAIVTGASRGFGRALTADLAAAGWRVVIDGRDRDALETTARRTGAIPVAGDVTDPSHRDELVSVAAHPSGSIDLLVNNASTLGAAPLPHLGDYP